MEHHGAGNRGTANSSSAFFVMLICMKKHKTLTPNWCCSRVLWLSSQIYPCYTCFPPKPLPPSCASHVGRFPWSWTWPFTQPHCHSCDAQIAKLKGDWKPCLHDNSPPKIQHFRDSASFASKQAYLSLNPKRVRLEWWNGAYWQMHSIFQGGQTEAP